MAQAQNDFNRKTYDQVLIRFPKGTLQRFKDLWGSDVSFNGWVVNLVCSRLLVKELYYFNKSMPYPDEPPKVDEKGECDHESTSIER